MSDVVTQFRGRRPVRPRRKEDDPPADLFYIGRAKKPAKVPTFGDAATRLVYMWKFKVYSFPDALLQNLPALDYWLVAHKYTMRDFRAALVRAAGHLSVRFNKNLDDIEKVPLSVFADHIIVARQKWQLLNGTPAYKHRDLDGRDGGPMMIA